MKARRFIEGDYRKRPNYKTKAQLFMEASLKKRQEESEKKARIQAEKEARDSVEVQAL